MVSPAFSSAIHTSLEKTSGLTRPKNVSDDTLAGKIVNALSFLEITSVYLITIVSLFVLSLIVGAIVRGILKRDNSKSEEACRHWLVLITLPLWVLLQLLCSLIMYFMLARKRYSDHLIAAYVLLVFLVLFIFCFFLYSCSWSCRSLSLYVLILPFLAWIGMDIAYVNARVAILNG